MEICQMTKDSSSYTYFYNLTSFTNTFADVFQNQIHTDLNTKILRRYNLRAPAKITCYRCPNIVTSARYLSLVTVSLPINSTAFQLFLQITFPSTASLSL